MVRVGPTTKLLKQKYSKLFLFETHGRKVFPFSKLETFLKPDMKTRSDILQGQALFKKRKKEKKKKRKKETKKKKTKKKKKKKKKKEKKEKKEKKRK